MSWKFKLSIIVLVLFAVWIIGAPLLANNLIVSKPLEKADAILVLSGSLVYKERTYKAAELYKKGVSRKIILNDDGGRGGWSQKERRNPPFVDLAKRELMLHGVLETDIEVLTDEVTGTIWEAKNLEKRIDKENWKSVLLVTSAYHTSRSLWVFQQVVGGDVKIGIESSPTGEETPPPWTWWLSARGWQVVAGEYVKFVLYWVYY